MLKSRWIVPGNQNGIVGCQSDELRAQERCVFRLTGSVLPVCSVDPAPVFDEETLTRRMFWGQVRSMPTLYSQRTMGLDLIPAANRYGLDAADKYHNCEIIGKTYAKITLEATPRGKSCGLMASRMLMFALPIDINARARG